MDSILDSVKKLLGISLDDDSFDADIMININSAIFTLRELGVLDHPYNVSSKENTYDEMFEDDTEKISAVKLYFYHKTRLGFDPPSSSAVLECLKKMVEEDEFRLSVWRKEVSK